MPSCARGAPPVGELDILVVGRREAGVKTADFFKDIPAIAPEDFQKSGYDLYPRLIFSTAKERESIYSGFTDQPAFRYQVSDEMKKVAGSIVSENKEETDIILKLQEKVVNEFKLWP